MEQDTKTEVSESEEIRPKPTSLEERICGHSESQQLQTPPSTITLNAKKKERPSSWEVEQKMPKKAICGECHGISEGATGLGPEHTFFQTTSLTTSPATTAFCNVDDRSIKDSNIGSEAPLSPDSIIIAANDASWDGLSSTDDGSNTNEFVANEPLDDTPREADFDGQVLVAIDTDNYSGTLEGGLDEYGSKDDIPGDVIYPQLPDLKNPGIADLDEVASDDCSNVNVVDHIPTSGPPTQPHLCDEQLALVELIVKGNNVFYTGSAGCGKSTVLKHLVPLLRQEGKRVDIITPTGRAALEVNGRTLYNYAGWVPHSLSVPLSILEKNAHGEKVWKRLTATDVLIIDEISMVANHVFERLDCIMKSARYSKEPFGGVQIIATGDFFQLPPVNAFRFCLECGATLELDLEKGEFECTRCPAHFLEVENWAFSSDAWKECLFEHVNLKIIHRQKDADFKELLERARLGVSWSISDKKLLLEHPSETRDAVRLFPRRVDVKAINADELQRLPGRDLTYLSVDDFYWRSIHDTLADKRIRCPGSMSHALEALEEHACEPKLILKEGMPVILVTNWDLDSSLANGSQGIIVGFEKHNPELLRKVPRKWAYSGRKNGLIKVFVKRAAVQEWPVVQFHNGIKRTIYPRCMMNELGDDEPFSLLSRTQIPLVAGWALTVHKAQGMTLSRVIVNLRHSFEPGQDYVALSRAESLAGLKVEGLPKEHRAPNKQVIDFMEENNLMPALARGWAPF